MSSHEGSVTPGQSAPGSSDAPQKQPGGGEIEEGTIGSQDSTTEPQGATNREQSPAEPNPLKEQKPKAPDERPIFNLRAPTPDPALVAAATGPRREAYEQDRSTLGQIDKVTDIFNLQRHVASINQSRGPGNEVTTEARQAMEEKLRKLSQGQWYNDVLQQARDGKSESVSLVHFRRMIAERDEIPFDTLRKILKLPLFDRLDQLSKELAARDKDIAALAAKVDGDKKCEEDKKALQSQIQQLSMAAETKDRTIENLKARASEDAANCSKEKNAQQDTIEALRTVGGSKDSYIMELKAQLESASGSETLRNEVIRLRMATAAKDDTEKALMAKSKQDDNMKAAFIAKSKQDDKMKAAFEKEIEALRKESAVSKQTIEEMKSEGKGASKAKRIAELKSEKEQLQAKLDNALNLELERRTDLRLANDLNELLNDDIDKKAEEIEKQTAEIMKKNEELREKDARIKSLEDRIKSLEGSTEARVQVVDLKGQITDLEKKLKECQEHLAQGQESKVMDEQTTQPRAPTTPDNTAKDKEITDLKTRLRDSEKHCEELTAELSSLKEANETLAAQLNAALAAITTAPVDDSVSKIERIQELEDQLQKRETEREDLSEQVTKLQSELSTVRKALDQEIKRLTDENIQVGGEKVEAEGEYEKMWLTAQQILKDLDQTKQQNSSLETEKKSWRTLQEQRIKEVNDLNDKLKEAASKEAELQSKLEKCEKKCKKLEREDTITGFLQNSSGLDGLPQLDPVTNPLQATVDNLRKKLAECEEHSRKHQDGDAKSESLVAESSLPDNDQKIRRLEDQVKELERKLKKEEEHNSKLSSEGSKCKSENEKLKAKLARTTRPEGGGLPSIDSNKNPLQATVDDLRSQLEKCEKHLKQLEDDKEKGPNDEAAAEIKRLRDQVNGLESDLEACNKQRRKLEGEGKGKLPDISGTKRPDSTPKNPQTPPKGGDDDSQDHGQGSTGLETSPETGLPASSDTMSSPATQLGASTGPTSLSELAELAEESDEIPTDPAEILAKLNRVMSINENFRDYITDLHQRVESERKSTEAHYHRLMEDEARRQHGETERLNREHQHGLAVERQATAAVQARERELRAELGRRDEESLAEFVRREQELIKEMKIAIKAKDKLEVWYWDQMKKASDDRKAELADLKTIIIELDPADGALRERARKEGPESDAARAVQQNDIPPEERKKYSYLTACAREGIPPEDHVFPKEERPKIRKEEEMALARGAARRKARKAKEAADAAKAKEAGPDTSRPPTVINPPTAAALGSKGMTWGPVMFGTTLLDAASTPQERDASNLSTENTSTTLPRGPETRAPAVQPESNVPRGGRPNDNEPPDGSGNGDPARQNRNSSRSWMRICLITLLVAITLLVLTVWIGWRKGQLLRTGYGYYYHGGFDGYNQDVCFGRWQFGFVVFLVWVIGVISFIFARGMAVSQEFVDLLAEALTTALIARRRPRRG